MQRVAAPQARVKSLQLKMSFALESIAYTGLAYWSSRERHRYRVGDVVSMMHVHKDSAAHQEFGCHYLGRLCDARYCRMTNEDSDE